MCGHIDRVPKNGCAHSWLCVATAFARISSVLPPPFECMRCLFQALEVADLLFSFLQPFVRCFDCLRSSNIQLVSSLLTRSAVRATEEGAARRCLAPVPLPVRPPALLARLAIQPTQPRPPRQAEGAMGGHSGCPRRRRWQQHATTAKPLSAFTKPSPPRRPAPTLQAHQAPRVSDVLVSPFSGNST